MSAPDVDRDEWNTLSRLLDRALELPPEERTAWVESLPPLYDCLRPRIHALLAGVPSGKSDGFLRTLPKFDASHGSLPDDSTEQGPPNVVGPYRVIRRLARGGMGAVWLAERMDGMVNRPVALKLPRRSKRLVGLVERMAEEREILAALTHPNIARLYDAGLTDGGQPYLALEFVNGEPIDRFVASRSLTIRQRLELFLQVTRAVSHAHARLIVHSDLKPSNILVTTEGEAKLLDFGIARLLDERRDGGVVKAARVLTPEYASPEQIAGEPLGIATDVYSSGVLLYELLTGVRPYAAHAASVATLQQAIRVFEPSKPSEAVTDMKVRRALRGDLDAIVRAAMRKRPEERYPTIDALAADIERHLQRRPVSARPDGVWYRGSKCVARHTVGAVALAAALVATIAGATLATWQGQIAVAEKRRAEGVRDFLITLIKDTSPYNAGRGLSAKDWLQQARARIDQHPELRPELRVELLNVVGASFINMQDTSSADEVLAQAVAQGEGQLGNSDPQTLRARVLMLSVHRFRGRTREMRAELLQLLPLLHGAGHALAEDLVVALKNQAHLEIDEGHYDRAERASQEAVDVSVRELGDRHPETVAARLIRAYAYQFKRNPEDALKAAISAYDNARAVYHDTPRHPRTIEGRLLYGRALGDAGSVAEGVSQLTHAVRDAADVFGASSRMVGFFSIPLAQLQAESGLVDEAVETSRTAVAIIAEHAGPASFRYATAVHQRGAALLAARRPKDALPDLELAATTLQKTVSTANPLLRHFAADLALARAQVGQFEESEALLEPLLSTDDAGPDLSQRQALYVAGVVKRLSGDAQASLVFEQRALTSIEPGRSGELRRMRVLTEIGLSLLDLQQPTDAMTALERALTISRQSQQQAGPDRDDIERALGRARRALDRDRVVAVAR